MSLPSYPQYKDSGVQWLGEIPAHWDMCRIKHVVRTFEQGWSPQCEGFPIENDQEWGILKVGCVNGGVFRRNENKALPAELEPITELSIRRGDLLISRANTRELVGSAAVARRDYRNLLLCDKLYRARVNHDICTPEYLGNYLGTGIARGQIELSATGASSSMVNIGQSTILEMLVPMPALQEQKQIIKFIDRETAKIDALITEQEKLIALLAEKRQAAISQAVTKGLDPDAPMKESGVAWLGEVPAHWKVCSLRRVISAIEQGWSPECHAREAEEGEWGVLKAGCLNGGIFRPTENKALPSELSPDPNYEVHVGDLLMSRASGSPELVGSTALVKVARPRLMLSDKIFRLRLQPFMAPGYFAAALRSRALRIQIENALSGGNGMANNLPQSSLLSFSILIPPKVEQQAIAEYIDDAVNKMDVLKAESDRAINLLKERRSALIAAAVTGQIDVRGAVVKEVEDAELVA